MESKSTEARSWRMTLGTEETVSGEILWCSGLLWKEQQKNEAYSNMLYNMK
jgi:hypothetical protein